jgi:hypothetical protein
MTFLAMRRCAVLAGGLIVTAIVAFGDLEGLFSAGRYHPAIGYDAWPARDTVAELNVEIQQGLAQLKFHGAQGYLESVLNALDVPTESQMVVFSKTSLMQGIINPRNPRSVFFNDSVAVAWVRGEPFVELAAEDPQKGVIFYTLTQTPVDQPRFIRRNDCLTCHESYASLGVPGMMVRSVFPAFDGSPVRSLGDYLSDHRSPFNERWGGWYVTGKDISVRHLGNAIVTNASQPDSIVTKETLSVESLKGEFDTDAYLSPYSDIVALMVFEHQMHAINLFTRVGWEVRFALYEARMRNALPGLGNTREPISRLLADTAKELVDYLLFIDEAPITGTIHGSSGFTEQFSARGPSDSKGRSLRQLDLHRRLMRYPCGYMIYTKAFDGLPNEARGAIYKRMWQVLSGEEEGGKYTRLSLADRQAIVEILRETKKGLPDYFIPVRQ